jgi:hypothetical protein
MSTDAPATHPVLFDSRRDDARQLAGTGLSNRKIGRVMGVSEATVRRWLRPDTLALPLTPDLRDDLAVLAQTGLDDAAAVARAVQLLADAYRTAWDYDDVPRGTAPHIRVIATAQPERTRPGE